MRVLVQIEFDKMLDLKTTKTSVSVGRSPSCDIIIPHDSISRQHCQIELLNGEYFITDSNSSNGTYINGKKLEPHRRTKYQATDPLKLGKLECEVGDEDPSDKTQEKLSAPTIHGEATVTTRIGRIDLNKPVNAEEIAKKVKPKGPRNPITDEIQNDQVEVVESKRLHILLFILTWGILAWLLIPIFS